MTIPDYGAIVDAILSEGEEIEQPVGLQEYYLSNHSKNIRTLETFDFSDEWLKGQLEILEFLKEELSDWWEDQLDDNHSEILRNWLDGNDIRLYVSDGYLDTLIEELTSAYRERITETWTCEECGKTISEKHPPGHSESIVRVGTPDDYPDGVPEDVDTSDVKYTNHIYCDRCWRRLYR